MNRPPPALPHRHPSEAVPTLSSLSLNRCRIHHFRPTGVRRIGRRFRTMPDCSRRPMLRELHISNLAVISDVRIELGPGLNCFTGATGAGKSLVIGAIEVLLGLRSPAEMLRPGAEEGRVSGVLDAKGKPRLAPLRQAPQVPTPA